MKVEWRNTRFRFRIKSWQFLAIWSLPFYKLFKCSHSLKITEVETVVEFQRWKGLIRWPPNGKRSQFLCWERLGWNPVQQWGGPWLTCHVIGGEQNSSTRPSERPWCIWFTTLCAPLFFCKPTEHWGQEKWTNWTPVTPLVEAEPGLRTWIWVQCYCYCTVRALLRWQVFSPVLENKIWRVITQYQQTVSNLLSMIRNWQVFAQKSPWDMGVCKGLWDSYEVHAI